MSSLNFGSFFLLASVLFIGVNSYAQKSNSQDSTKVKGRSGYQADLESGFASVFTFLMIEDDTEFAELLSEYLAQYDIKITNFEDPYLGLSAGVKKYDLLILDLTLPGMDGLEVCKEVVEKYDIPIIISSARSDINDKVEGFAIGADDYLPKPYDPKEMYARITSLLRRYSKSEKADMDFHARYSVISKRYIYLIQNTKITWTTILRRKICNMKKLVFLCFSNHKLNKILPSRIVVVRVINNVRNTYIIPILL